MVTGVGQRRHLMAPGEPEFGEAVGQHHQGRTGFAGLQDPQTDPVGVDEPLGGGQHALIFDADSAVVNTNRRMTCARRRTVGNLGSLV